MTKLVLLDYSHITGKAKSYALYLNGKFIAGSHNHITGSEMELVDVLDIKENIALALNIKNPPQAIAIQSDVLANAMGCDVEKALSDFTVGDLYLAYRSGCDE